MFQNKKGAIAASMVSGLALVASLAFVGGGTYARYVATAEGNGSASVAKWAVKVNGNDSNTFNLDFNAENNPDIVAGKIAPGVTATGYVDIDLTDTEVSVEIDCECALSNSGDNAIPVKVEVGDPVPADGASNMTVMPKTEDNPVIVKVNGDHMNGTVRVPVTLTWDSDSEATDDDADTAAGKTAENMTVPVKLQVRQYIEPTR